MGYQSRDERIALGRATNTAIAILLADENTEEFSIDELKDLTVQLYKAEQDVADELGLLPLGADDPPPKRGSSRSKKRTSGSRGNSGGSGSKDREMLNAHNLEYWDRTDDECPECGEPIVASKKAGAYLARECSTVKKERDGKDWVITSDCDYQEFND